MKLIKPCFTLLCLAILLNTSGQDYNPYKSIGKKAKILTAYGGKFVEVFDYDSIQRIGTILFNIKTKRIVKLLPSEQTFSKFSDNSSASRWYSIDPKANTIKNCSYSPYNFVVNNPILFVDPDGQDWYKDNKGTMQFDPKVQSQKDLKDGQTYVGDTYQEKNKKGKVTTDYREDGSIMYSNQKDAYKRLKNNSAANGNREEFGVITKKGVLVLPDYKNGQHDIDYKADYGYSFKGGNLADPVSGNTLGVLGTIHTHLAPNGDPGPSYQDVGTFGQQTPYKIFMTMGHDGKVYGAYAFYPPGSGTANYGIVDKYLKPGGLTNDDLTNGYDLIGVLESITIKK